MKTAQMILIIIALFISSGYSKKNTADYEKEEALKNFTVCSRLANDWLKKLDSTDYSYLSFLGSRLGGNEIEISSYINKVRMEYGKINSRELLGSHIYFYSNQKMLTYAPDIEESYLAHIHAVRSEDGFYIVEPKYFGLTSYRQMFAGLPEGDYVMLMYKVSPTNKSYAEELLIFVRARWNNPDSSWQVTGYKIADEI